MGLNQQPYNYWLTPLYHLSSGETQEQYRCCSLLLPTDRCYKPAEFTGRK